MLFVLRCFVVKKNQQAYSDACQTVIEYFVEKQFGFSTPILEGDAQVIKKILIPELSSSLCGEFVSVRLLRIVCF